ncbi:MAG: 50S ribosomal protein L4 [Oscillospiraceae bacterium]|nr:50S ribosomal protein L4 [Oscillospiraceae bacterium]
MPKAVMYNMAGEQVGEYELSEAVFGIEPNEAVLHAAVKNYLANQRQGTQSALTKGEVSYSTKKPWRQKGTGRARAGYKGSPVWTHGGVAFAPKPRDYSYRLNKKVKRLALKSALSAKAQESGIIVIDGLKMDEPKTKTIKTLLDKVGATGKTLVVTGEGSEAVVKSARNIPGVYTAAATLINPYVVLDNACIVVDKAALEKIEEVFA